VSVIEKYLVTPDKLLVSNKLYELGYSELGKYKLYIENKVEFIAKPTTVTFSNEGIIITFPNGIRAVLSYGRIKHSAEEFYRLVRTNLKWVVVKAKKPVIVDYDEVIKEPSYDVADNILSSENPLDAIVRGLGYEPRKEVVRVVLPRVLPLIRTPRPIHVWQFTNYNTGKTEMGIMYMKVFNWFYSTTPPTEAGLTYDARTGTLGAVLISEGIVFDEVDKWSSSKVIDANLMSFLPTLMEQGAVVRPTTRRTFIGIIERRIPFMFLGNVSGSSDYGYGSDRERLKNYLQQWGDFVGALADRFTVIDFNYEEIYISDYVTGRVLPESVLTAMIEILNREVARTSLGSPSSLRGRLKRHSENLCIALKVLGHDVRTEWCDRIVEVGWSRFLEEVSASA